MTDEQTIARVRQALADDVEVYPRDVATIARLLDAALARVAEVGAKCASMEAVVGAARLYRDARAEGYRVSAGSESAGAYLVFTEVLCKALDRLPTTATAGTAPHDREPDHCHDCGLSFVGPHDCRPAVDAERVAPAERDDLGRLVRAVWVAWAREQANPKAAWLVPWEELPEADREVDRRIGEMVAARAIEAFLYIRPTREQYLAREAFRFGSHVGGAREATAVELRRLLYEADYNFPYRLARAPTPETPPRDPATKEGQ